ncbi:MAG: hypothetical protein WBG47_12090, partial [Gordonia sp. (in: high G+C Gram-positive bacteria)]
MKTRLSALTLGLAVAVGSALLVPATALAAPVDDATTAINQLSSQIESGAVDRGFNDAGLGAKKGSVTESGDGFKQVFAGGTIFWSEKTGAKVLYGAIDERYTQQNNGPADIGFPDTNEADSTVGDPSRVAEFAGTGDPKIFWTPTDGAWLVRGPMSAASTELGKTLGVPTAEMKVDGTNLTQSFANGDLTFDLKTGKWSSMPASLAASLSGLKLPNWGADFGLPGVELPKVSLPSVDVTAPSVSIDAPTVNVDTPNVNADNGGISPWWWLLLLLLPLLFLLAWTRRRKSYDYKAVKPATGPGFPEVTPERTKRLAGLADGTESSAAGSIAKSAAAATAAATPVRPGARV